MSDPFADMPPDPFLGPAVNTEKSEEPPELIKDLVKRLTDAGAIAVIKNGGVAVDPGKADIREINKIMQETLGFSAGNSDSMQMLEGIAAVAEHQQIEDDLFHRIEALYDPLPEGSFEKVISYLNTVFTAEEVQEIISRSLHSHLSHVPQRALATVITQPGFAEALRETAEALFVMGVVAEREAHRKREHPDE